MAHYYCSYKSTRSVVDGDKSNNLVRKATPVAAGLPFRFSTNPGQLPDVTTGSPFEGGESGFAGLSTTPLLYRTSLGHLSPLRGRTMKEYDHQIQDLNRENFNLKLRIYFLEEKLQRKFSDSTDDVHKLNLELKIEVESLKKDLSDRQELLVKASSALDAMETTHKTDMNELRSQMKEQQGQFDEQIRRLQEALELAQQQISKSDAPSGDDSNREELYQQAFAPFPIFEDVATSLATKNEEKVSDWQEKIRGLNDEVSKLNAELSAGQNRIQELERAVSDKEAYLKEEEINTVKRHKFIQGLLTNVKNKEKQLSQLQEQFDLQSVELKDTKEKLNHLLKRVGDNSTNQDQDTDEQKSLKLIIEGLRKEKDNLELTWRETVRQRDESLLVVQLEFEQQMHKKDELVKELRNAVEQRNVILENCLRLVGAIDFEEKVSDSSLNSVTDILRFKINEKESKIQTIIEERIKLLKEKDNELIRVQESNLEEKNRRQAQFEAELNVAQKSLEELQKTLIERDKRIEDLHKTIQDLQSQLNEFRKNRTANYSKCYPLDNREEEEFNMNQKCSPFNSNRNDARRKSGGMTDQETQADWSEEHMNDVMCRLQAVLSDKNEESSKLQNQLKMKEDFITNLKGFLEILLNDTNSNNIPNDCEKVRRNDKSVVEQKLADLEDRVKNSSTRNKYLDEQLVSVKQRMVTLRQIIEGSQNGSGDHGEITTKELTNKNLEENLQAVFRGVKLMTNLNDIFRQQIQMNNDRIALDCNNGTHNAFNPQMIVDMALEIQELKAKALNCSVCKNPSGPNLSNEVVAKQNGCDGEQSPLNLATMLHDSQEKIGKLHEKLSSTENTVHLLGNKLKLYRKLLHDNGCEIPSPRNCNSSFTFPPLKQIEGKTQSSNREIDRPSPISRRSVSVDDVRISHDDKIDGVRNLVEDNQAFSADDILSPVTNTVVDNQQKSVANLDGSTGKFLDINIDILKRNSPYTPDSLLDYGQSNDLLELKEQICHLKLRLEELQIANETFSEREIGRFTNTANNFRHLSHLNSMLKEQSLTPSERNVSGSYVGDLTLPSGFHHTQTTDADCQAGDGIVRNFNEGAHSFENVDEELQWLHNLNAMLQAQLDVAIREIPEGRYSTYIQLQQQDISSLRHRLLDSHDACEILRVRLEELAEFLEQLLRFDENGFLDLSRFTPQRVESLKRHIAESRQLSHSLSQSLLLDVTDVSNVTNFAESAASHESMQHFYNNGVNKNAQCLSSCLKEQERRTSEENVNDGHVIRSRSSLEWSGQDGGQKSEAVDGVWSRKNSSGLLRVAEPEPLPSELGRNYVSAQSGDKLDGVMSVEREFEWKHRNSRWNSHESHRFYQDMSSDRYRNHEPSKLAQSSCDDLILLLDAREQNTPDFNSDPSAVNGTELVESRHLEEPVADALQVYSSNNENDMRSLDTMRERAIMEEYVRHYTSKPFEEEKDRWSSYQRMGHSVSHRKELFLPETEKKDAQKNRLLLSPSDSESWSEPDRDVSQQRIGLELDEAQFAVSRDRPFFGRSPKSLKLHTRSFSNSESAGTTDASLRLASSKITSSPAANRRSRSESVQVDDLERRLRSLEDINNVLRSELKIYQALSTKSTSQPNLKGYVSAALQTSEGSAVARRRNSGGDKVQMVLNEHLIEIRALRLQLEESITTNDKLREKLEQRLVVKQQCIRNSDREITQLNAEVNEKERLIGQIDCQLKHHVRKERELQVEADELHQQISDLTEKLQSANAQANQLERDLASRDESTQQLKNANQRLQGSVVNLQTVLADKERVVKELREANNRLQRTLETMDGLMCQQMSEAKERLKMEAAQGAQRLLEVQEKQKASEKTAKEALEVFEGLKADFKRKEEEKDILEKMVEDLRNALSETERQLEEEHGSRLSLQQKMNTLAGEISEKERALKKNEEKVLDLERMLQTAEKDFIEQRDKADELSTFVKERDVLVGQLREGMVRMQEAVAEKKRSMERQLEFARALEKKVEMLSGAASEKEVKGEEKAKEFEAKLIEAQAESKKLMTKLEKQEKIYLDLQVKLDERGTTIRALEDELHTASEDNEKLQQQLLTAKGNLAETSELNRSMKSELQIYEHLHANVAYKNTATSALANRRTSVPASGTLDIDLEQLLTEMRHLRTQLEVSIQTNNALRGQLEEHFTSKLNENAEDVLRAKAFGSPTVQKRIACLSWTGHSLSDSAPIVKKVSSLPCDRGDIFPDGNDGYEHPMFIRQHSKSSDYVSEDQSNSLGKESKTKAERPSRLHVSLPPSSIEPGSADRSPLGQTDSHSVYSSPDLGIESDPSHFSSLERKMSDITEEHLVEIRKSQLGIPSYKNGKLSANGSCQRSRKTSSEGTDDRRFLYAVGRLGDYGFAKKEMEGGVSVVKGLQVKIRELMQSCPKNSPSKKLDYSALKELHVRSNNVNACLGKSLKAMGCFWTATLPPQGSGEPNDTKTHPKIVEENLLLKKKLSQQRNNLQDALTKLAASNRLKEGMEKAIMKQLSKTHDVLKRAKGNLEDKANPRTE